jgi:hypothetical protein
MEHLIDYAKIALDSYNGTYGEQYKLLWCGTIHHETISMLEYRDVVYVAITGSNDKWDWIRNFWAAKKSVGKGILIHRGFHNGFKRIKNQMKRTLQEANPSEVVFIGHSKGGAIAQIAAWFFAQTYDVSCYSFGSPRVGNKKFRDHINYMVSINLRVVIQSDIVTMVPKINYHHAGIPIYLPKQDGIGKSHSVATYYHLLHQSFPPMP